jgi:hypothetical protein
MSEIITVSVLTAGRFEFPTLCLSNKTLLKGLFNEMDLADSGIHQ